MKSAMEEAKANPIPDDKYGASQAWKAKSSKLASDNTALVTTVNDQTSTAVVVHLTHASGDWRVTGAERATRIP